PEGPPLDIDARSHPRPNGESSPRRLIFNNVPELPLETFEEDLPPRRVRSKHAAHMGSELSLLHERRQSYLEGRIPLSIDHRAQRGHPLNQLPWAVRVAHAEARGEHL